MRKEGVPETQIQQLKALVDKNTQEAYKIGKQGAKELREYIHQANTQ
ncbi:MAG: hypothetical protein JJ714_09695 [Acidithiobacillus sp.]|nr:hypothetical protein [Acidithiobacillus sp.]